MNLPSIAKEDLEARKSFKAIIDDFEELTEKENSNYDTLEQ